MKMTIFIEKSGWFDVGSELSLEVKDLDMARGIVDFMLSNGANVRNAVVYDAIEFVRNGAKETFNYTDCRMCGNEWKSLNEEGFCSSCWAVWKS